MTGIAVTNTAGIVSPGSTGESCGGMTGGTIQAGRNVSWYGIHHACRRIPIVAGSAIVDDPGMIEGSRHEAAGGMADTAILVSVDMVGFLGCGETSIMTGGAVIYDADMIEGCRQETRGHVTIATVCIGRHMEVAFTGGGNPIMAGCTVIHDTLVFEPGIGKGGRGMTYRAILGGWYVAGVGFGVLTGCVYTIVAGCTVIHDTGMIEYRRLEAAACCMADSAILGCRDVVGVHTFCRTSPIGYMTGIAAYG